MSVTVKPCKQHMEVVARTEEKPIICLPTTNQTSLIPDEC